MFGFPSQFTQPAAPIGLHAPAVQESMPLALLHAVPQAPQFKMVLSASQPLLEMPSQFPAGGSRAHSSPEHEALALAKEQTLGQLRNG